MLSYYYVPGGGSGRPNFQEALLTMADRRVVRQGRGRVQSDDPPECRPWGPWGAHEICDVSGWLHPDGGLVDCEEVPDFSCDELLELFEAEPLPATPCGDRTEDDCEGPLTSERSCDWRPEFATYSGDSCEPLAGPGACLELDRVDEPECTLPSVCAGAEGTQVVFRDNGDGSFDVMNGYGCWQYDGFERCEWDAEGQLVVGPEACNCACGA